MSSDRPVDKQSRAPAVIRQFADLDELSAAVADEFCQIANQAIAVRGRCTVVLAGGSTPRRLYGLLASEPFRHRVRWDNIEFFWGDDRAVPPDHDNSNFGMVRELLLEPLAIPAAHIHRIPSEQKDLEAAASAYEKEVARVFDVPAGGPPPAFDLVLLGMGADGHTASLFPGAGILNEGRRWVVPFHADEGSGTGDRVTMTPQLFNAARNVIFMVAGPDKAETLARVLEDASDPQRWPAQMIRPTSGVLRWFVDASAAAKLSTVTASGGCLVISESTSLKAIAVEDIPGVPFLEESAPDPCALVIFGAFGDLSRRKLIPALYNLMADGKLSSPFGIVGVDRHSLTLEEFQAGLRESADRFSRRKPDDEVWNTFASAMALVEGRFEEERTYSALKETLAEVDRDRGTLGNRIFYFATPPALFPVILQNLHRSGLLHRDSKTGGHPICRVIIEKPFGTHFDSARALNELIAEYLDESQTFRIDHYLGKETVQNILVFRFGNSIFEPLWNRKHVDHVQIVAAESIGIDRRGRFYDATGVLRDVVQNHLLQVLALTAMEPPTSFGADDIRDEKLQVFRALRPILGGDVGRNVVRAQYRGYTSEEGVSPDSRTPTFVAMKLMIDNWRWQGVPFYLRAGKRLAGQRTDVSIHFQPVPLCLFEQTDVCQALQPSVLTLRIQPHEGISLRFIAKVPGDALAVSNVSMNMAYADAFRKPISEAYERLLLDCMRGDATLFTRRDAVEQAWRFVTPILEQWDAESQEPIPQYEPGSGGPPEADKLIARDKRRWR